MLTPQQLQAAGSKMSTAANAGGLPPPSYASNPGGMTGATLDNFVTGTPATSKPASSSTGLDFTSPTSAVTSAAETGFENIPKAVNGAVSAVKTGVEGIGDSLKKNAAIQENPAAPGQHLGSEIAEGADLAGKATSLPFEAIGGAAGALIPHQVKDAAGTALHTTADAITNNPEALKALQTINDLADKHPEIAKLVGGIGTTALNVGGGEGATPSVVGGIDATKSAVEGGVDALKNGITGAGEALAKTGSGASDILGSVKKAASKGNVSENLGSSIDRLSKANVVTPDMTRPEAIAAEKGLGITNNPLDAYDKYYSQEQKFKGDAKEDTALGLVGSKVGDAYNQVAQMRRGAGASMGEEMDKIGNTPVDVTAAEKPLEDELAKSGISIDPESGKVTGERTSKLSSQDQKMIENYAQELKTLGPTPTAKELDAFLSRVPNELDVYKNQNNIIKATNGERIIKGHLADLAEQLKPGTHPETGEAVRSEFAPYAKAKGDYAALSNFLKEGQGFLGKKTLSGDYAKDASLAKSSIQSALNGGKKDFLIKLEKLTGFPAVDHSMLALQAMKDAGNFRGESLLDLLSPQSKGKLPLTKEGMIGHAIDATVGAGKKALVGDANTQTRRIIQDQMAKSVEDAAPGVAEKIREPKIAPRGFIKIGGKVDTETAKAMDAQHDAVHEGLNSLDSKDFLREGKLSLPLYSEAERLQQVFEKGKATMDDVRQGTELLKLLGKTI